MIRDVEVPDWLDVSDETTDRLVAFSNLVKRWNPAINLVSKSSIADIWTRHLLDSAQLFQHCPTEAKSWLDIGSGAGFPGMVMAIMAAECRGDLRVTMVESDRRKSVFLTEANRILNLSATVICSRIDDVPPQEADVVSARALAPLTVLCGHANRHLSSSGVAVFPKGANAAAELVTAQQQWNFNAVTHPSRTDADAAILVLKDIQHV